MSAKGTASEGRRAIVIVVGTDTSDRNHAARTLIDQGQSVILCSGPPGCPLVRDEPCALVDVADAVVFMPHAQTHDRRVDAALSRCANSASCSIVLEGPATVPWPDNAIHVAADDLVGVSRGIRRTNV